MDRQAAVVQRQGRDLRSLLQRDHRTVRCVDPPGGAAGRELVGPDRRPVPRHRLSGRRHELRFPPAVDRRDPRRLRRRRRDARRPLPARGHQRKVRREPGRATPGPARGPAHPRPRRHGRQLVPVPLAGQLRGQDQRAGAHHLRLPGRADRPPGPDERVRPPLELDLEAPRADQRRARHQHREPRVQGPHRVDGLLDAEQEQRRPRHEDRHGGPRDRVRPEGGRDEDVARDPRLPGRRQGGR